MLRNFKSSDFAVSSRHLRPLSQFPTHLPDFYSDAADYEIKLHTAREELIEIQELLHAQDEQSLLIILQGMDTSGKDGLIKHVFSGVNPMGCSVHAFKRPTAEELDHDFLWRTHKLIPARGQIGIFNRSYYEDVLVVRVHPQLLAASKIPEHLRKAPRLWRERYEDIVNHERYLSRQGVKIVKFYLHLSRAEQKKRLIARIDDPGKHWKIDPGDFKDRKQWTQYQMAYNECLRATSSTEAPWYVIPADDKKNARLMFTHVLVETVRTMKLPRPKSSRRSEAELQKLKRALLRER